MLQYVQYFVAWLFFMALIAGITLIVPKLAQKIDKWRAEKKAEAEKSKSESDVLISSPAEPESTPEADEKAE